MDALSFEDYHRHRNPAMARYATAILGRDEAEDAVQDAWLKAWRAWGAADPDRVDAWVLRIVRNTCLDHLRHASREMPLTAVAATAGPTPYRAKDLDALDEDPAERAVTRATSTAVAPLLNRLPPDLRQTLWLREGEGLTYGQIAHRLHVPIGTVMSRLHRARAKAARLLRHEGR